MLTKQLNPIDIMNMTTERANWLWERISKQSTCFDDFARGRGDLFAARLCSPGTMAIEYGDSGLITVENIMPKLSASMHFFVWDPEVHEKEVVEAGKQVVTQAFEMYQLHRLIAAVPKFNTFAQRIAMRVGFKYEGTAREAFLFRNVYHDVLIYGLLAYEFGVL